MDRVGAEGMAKRIFIILLAVNALIVLYVVMNKELQVADTGLVSFDQKGKLVSVINQNRTQIRTEGSGNCGEVGPASSLDLIEQASQRLIARNIDNNILQKDLVVSTDYWVIIPPRASERQAYRLLKQLQLANIDSYIVTQGDYANAISLGLFTIRESAVGVKDKMIDAGFDVVIQEIERTQKHYWLTFSGDLSVVKQLLAELKLIVSNKSCKSR